MLPVSIVIATYNRIHELKRTLTGLRNVEPVAEIIVVDNASSDHTADVVQREFPEVRLLKLACNKGVPAFGTGVQAASQPFVFLLDDDASPDAGTLTQVVRVLVQQPRVAVVACHIFDDSSASVTLNWPENPLCFWGCGAGCRKSALMSQPYLYDPVLFLHGTEMDLAIRLYAKGYTVHYLPSATIHHRFSSANRSEARRIYHLVQSAIRFASKHLPLKFALLAVLRHLVWLLVRANHESCLKAYMLGLVVACRHLPSSIKERKPVPEHIARIYYEQVWEYEPITHRLLRHLSGWPISRKYVNSGFPSQSQTLSDSEKL